MQKRKDGRYQSSVMLTDPLTNEKRRVYVYGYTEEEVQREKEHVRQNNGVNDIFKNITFGRWLDEWLQIKKDEITPSTYDNYKMMINNHILPYLKNIHLNNITPATIRQVLRNITAGNRTKKYVYVLLNAILQQAYTDDIIKRNPCVSVTPPKYKAKEK